MSHNIETEILNYNFAPVGIQHKKDVEHTDLPSLLECLKEYCITRDSPLWQHYSIEGVIRKGGEKYHKLGSKQTQFCKYCGETIYFDMSGRSSNTTIPERGVSDYKDLGQSSHGGRIHFKGDLDI